MMRYRTRAPSTFRTTLRLLGLALIGYRLSQKWRNKRRLEEARSRFAAYADREYSRELKERFRVDRVWDATMHPGI